MNDFELVKNPELINKRAMAYGIDSVIAIGIQLLNGPVLLLFLLMSADADNAPAFAIILLTVAMLAIMGLGMGYFVFRDGLEKGSFGKRRYGLRVVNFRDGTPCTMRQSAIRNGILMALGLIDLVFGFIREDGRRLGDEIAGTLVVPDEGHEPIAKS